MLMTAELKGLAGIAGTAFGAVTGPAAIALTRRADRKHEANLDFEKRARQDKQQALIRIFGTLSEMRRACEPESSWKPQGESEEIQFARMRAGALRSTTKLEPTLSRSNCSLTDRKRSAVASKS